MYFIVLQAVSSVTLIITERKKCVSRQKSFGYVVTYKISINKQSGYKLWQIEWFLSYTAKHESVYDYKIV